MDACQAACLAAGSQLAVLACPGLSSETEGLHLPRTLLLSITLSSPSFLPSPSSTPQRLEDIHALERSMADEAGWARLAPAEQQDKRRFYQASPLRLMRLMLLLRLLHPHCVCMEQQDKPAAAFCCACCTCCCACVPPCPPPPPCCAQSQQRAAGGFMYQAVTTLRMLNTLTQHPDVQRSFLEQPIAGRAANAVRPPRFMPLPCAVLLLMRGFHFAFRCICLCLLLSSARLELATACRGYASRAKGRQARRPDLPPAAPYHPTPASPAAAPPALQCVHFLDLLVGPRCSQLAVERPEQYHFTPGELLVDTAHLLLRLAEHGAFVKVRSGSGGGGGRGSRAQACRSRTAGSSKVNLYFPTRHSCMPAGGERGA